MIYDTLIIGAGLSGLMTGYILAKEGQKVCIVEKNPIPGGLMQNFRVRGKVFDAGAHYFGGLKESQSLHAYFRYFGLLDKIDFKQLDLNAYDRFLFQDREIAFPQGHENYIEHLSKLFPKEAEGIRHFTNHMRKTVHQYTGFNLSHENDESFVHLAHTNAFEEISRFVSDKKLRHLLFANAPAYDGRPESTPFYIYALLSYSYIESAWRVLGGSGKIAEILEQNFTKAGGEIRYKFDVQAIETDSSGRVSGLKSVTDEKLFGQRIISTVHPSLLPNMLPVEQLRKAYRNRLSNLKNTTGMFSIYAVMKPKRFAFMNSVNYCYNSTLEQADKVYARNTFAEKFIFLTQPQHHRQIYAETAQILSPMPYAEVARFADTKVRRRGKHYFDFKQKMTEKLMELVSQYFPGFSAAVAHINTGTPLTYRDYSGSKEGAVYGVLKDSRNPMLTTVSHRTKIPNLFIGGQSANIHGIHGTAAGAFVLCSDILGEDYLQKKMLD